MSNPLPSGSMRRCIRDLSPFSLKVKWNTPDSGNIVDRFIVLDLIVFMTELILFTGPSIMEIFHRPPPAQAQAHPAQAQAHAQEKPPPPLYPPFDGVVETFGGGLVIDVILVVKSLIFPTTLPEKLCTPAAMDAAKSAPGTLETPPPIEAGAPPGLEDIFPKPGS